MRNAVIREDMTTLKEIRLFGPQDAGISALLVDNVACSLMEEYSIDKIEADKMLENGDFDCNSTELKLFINGSIQTSALKAEDFSIANENGAAGVSEAVYDNSHNCIILRLDSKLDFDSVYTLQISEHLIKGNSSELGKAMSKTFKTGMPDLGAAPKGISGENLTVTITNRTDNAEEIYVIAGVYDGESFVAMTVEKILAQGKTEKDYTVTVNKALEGDNVRVFVWDSLTAPEMLCKNVTVY